MFIPKTERLKEISSEFPAVIEQVTGLFTTGAVNIYIDYANIRPWSEKLGWHIEPVRLKQFLKSFDNVKSIRFYQGELVGDQRSQAEIRHLKSMERGGFLLRTKPVKIMKFSIDITSIDRQSPHLLRHFIRASLLRKLDVDLVELLNSNLGKMNNNGIYELEDRKCNFDVEIGSDMLVDHIMNKADVFVLWSGDSDFADPIRQLLEEKRKVILFATSRRVSSELSLLCARGLIIFDIQKIRNFVCWSSELNTKKQRGPFRAPKL